MLLYENLDILLPTITNTSLTTGIVPCDLKTAIGNWPEDCHCYKPLLKKPSLNKNLLKEYCPIHYLPFLSKITEKGILHKLLSSPRKQPHQPLSVSLLSRTQRRDCFVTCCKWYSLHSGQWQHFCSFLRSFCSFWHYWPPNSPLLPKLCFWHSVYCTSMVLIIPLRQISIHFSQ